MIESFKFLYKNFNIVAESAAIIFLGIVLYLLTKKFISKSFDKFKEKIDTRKYKTFQIACNSIIKYIIFFVIICMFFNVLGIDIKSILTVAGIGSITVGLAAQSLIKDFITGIFILFENQFEVGDKVIIANKAGTVESITMCTTTLRAANGDVYIIPNGEIKIVTNKSRKTL